MLPKLKTALIAGLAAGTADMSAAIIVYSLLLKLAPAQRIMQSVAAGALGPASYKGGWNTAITGLFLHFCIAMLFAFFYTFTFKAWHRLLPHALLAGLVYGVLVWCVMNLAVVPLATGKAYTFTLKYFLISIGIIILCVGMPITAIVKKRLQA